MPGYVLEYLGLGWVVIVQTVVTLAAVAAGWLFVAWSLLAAILRPIDWTAVKR